MSFSVIRPEDIKANVFTAVDRQWMLITAGNAAKYNMMTASWGGMGVLWNKDVAFCFIRPQRYTFGLMEDGDYYTLSFLPEKYRQALNICGSKSGRDIDKTKATGLTPVTSSCGAVYFAEAETVLVCRKLYRGDLCRAGFMSGEIPAQQYAGDDYHRMYIGEIIEVLRNEDM